MSADSKSLSTRVATLRFDPAELARPGLRDHLMTGLIDQDQTFLALAAAHGVDPRRSVRVGVAADGSLVAVSARAASVEELLHTVRRAPKQITVTLEERPLVHTRRALLDSRSTVETAEG